MSEERDKELKTRRVHEPREDLEALENNLITAQRNVADATNEFGYQLEVVRACKPYWANMSNPPSDPSFNSGFDVISAWLEQSKNLAMKTDETAREIGNMSGTASYIASTTVILNKSYPVNHPSLDEHSLQNIAMQRTEQDFVEEELRKIDSALADTYTTVWQYLNFPAFDPTRGPLFLMRHVFDHFLKKLAPDSDVESQPNFQPDAELKERNGKGITRKHRIDYIAKKRVQDPKTRQSMMSSSGNFQDIYRGHNKAHKRGTLNENSAKEAVYLGNTLLANWLRAIS